MRHFVTLLLVLAPLAAAEAQGTARPHAPGSVAVPATAADTAADAPDDDNATDDDGAPIGLQFGVASGAVSYGGGRSEQGLGLVVRWAPLRWFSMSATPSVAHLREPSGSAQQAAQTRSGLTDIPPELALTHPFTLPMTPTLSLGMGASLPVGDTASGFGASQLSCSSSVGLGLTPHEGTWTNASVGKALSGVSPRAAIMTGSAWGDVSAGAEVTDRLSFSAGYSSDLGAVDSTLGRSTALEGGVALRVQGHQTLHLNASRGLSGAAPQWSVGVAFGTAFPYLNHLGAGSSLAQSTQGRGAGTHGLERIGDTTGATTTGRGHHP